jgi:hypothetical protein
MLTRCSQSRRGCKGLAGYYELRMETYIFSRLVINFYAKKNVSPDKLELKRRSSGYKTQLLSNSNYL